tara:strand:+ start:6237 stop:6947 length:711 start_codon:yes stop_codon:yes gene_type:complete
MLENETEEYEAGGEVESVEAPAPDLSETIRETVQSTMQGMHQQQQQEQQQQQAQKPMSQDEINKRLNVYSFTDADSTQMHEALRAEDFNPAAFTGMMNNMLNGLSKQHSTFAELVSQAQLEQFSNNLRPHLTAAQEVQKERREDNFFKSYKALEPFKKILPSVSQQVAQTGLKFASAKEANAAVAQAAEALIKQTNPNFSLGKPSRTGKPARTTFPGGGGGGQSAASQGSSASIWD